MHVGIIVDGNRRWAKQRGLNPWDGHKEGVKVVKQVLKKAYDLGIDHLTLYLWSLKNEEKRDRKERWFLFQLLKKELPKLVEEAEKRGVKINFLGSWQGCELSEQIKEAQRKTKQFNNKTLNLCFYYDGQDEIIQACQKIIDEKIKKVDKQVFEQHLYGGEEVPEVDLVIRTGMNDGKRISGFMLWRINYAEFIFHDTYWPDYTPEMLEKDLEEFKSRNRRFGK